MKKAIILFAHGSRDPLWHKPMDAVASQIQSLAPHLKVVSAYLELSTPDLPTVMQHLVADGVNEFSIVPLFLGVGKHAREDLPAIVEALRLKHPNLTIRLARPVGEHPKLTHLLAKIALESVQ